MIGVLSKPADQVSVEDLEELTASRVPEGEQIEFKKSLPAERGSTDDWMSGGDRIGKRAKTKLLEEVVAFANAFGGTLLLGIEESKEKPPVADSISPIPRCQELAERLKLVFRDCVEPQLPRVEVFAIITEDDEGVVIIRTDRSRLAPHRVKTTLECTVRRSDRCEKMTMREIQDMTLNMSRGLKRLEKRLAERSVRFEQEFKRLRDPSNAFGIRMTAMPVVDVIRIHQIFSGYDLAQGFLEPWHDVIRSDGRPVLALGRPSGLWIPILRGARSARHGNEKVSRDYYRELHCDGLVEFGYVSCISQSVYDHGNMFPFHVDWFIDMFANSITQSHRIRCESGFPSIEYMVELEIVIKGLSALEDSSHSPYAEELLLLKLGKIRFPHYLLKNSEDFPSILSQLARDFWNLLGKDFGEIHFRIERWPNQA